MMKTLKKIIPTPIKKSYRRWDLARQAWNYLTQKGYDGGGLKKSLESVDPAVRSVTLDWLYQCAILENQPYFKPDLWSRFFGREKNESLYAAMESCLYGLYLEKTLLGDWQNASASSIQAQKNMIRVLNQSLIHAVRFCGGWEKLYQNRMSEVEPTIQTMSGLLAKCSGRVLDIGAGGMPFCPILKDRTDFVESDLNIQALKLMRLALGLSSQNLVCSHAEDLPFADASFHVVISRYVIENLLNPANMLRQAYRVLTNGGSFVILVPPVIFGESQTPYFTNRKSFESKTHFEKVVQEIGFVIEKVESPNFIYCLKKPGVLNVEEWQKGYKKLDESTHLLTLVDQIPVYLPNTLKIDSFGELGFYHQVKESAIPILAGYF